MLILFLIVIRERLENGLAKLSEANELVGTYQEKLKTLGPQIEEKQRV